MRTSRERLSRRDSLSALRVDLDLGVGSFWVRVDRRVTGALFIALFPVEGRIGSGDDGGTSNTSSSLGANDFLLFSLRSRGRGREVLRVAEVLLLTRLRSSTDWTVELRFRLERGVSEIILSSWTVCDQGRAGAQLELGSVGNGEESLGLKSSCGENVTCYSPPPPLYFILLDSTPTLLLYPFYDINTSTSCFVLLNQLH